MLLAATRKDSPLCVLLTSFFTQVIIEKTYAIFPASHPAHRTPDNAC